MVGGDVILDVDRTVAGLQAQERADLALMAIVLGMADDHADAVRRMENVVESAREKAATLDRRRGKERDTALLLDRVDSVGRRLLGVARQMAKRAEA